MVEGISADCDGRKFMLFWFGLNDGDFPADGNAQNTTGNTVSSFGGDSINGRTRFGRNIHQS
jgi:hypothetical protein